MVSWKRQSARRAAARSARTAPANLRTHLPLLWPDGPDRPPDTGALQALSREYARTGRGVEDLLSDLDQLCSVLGIDASSRMIETSSVAWADAFLDTVGSSGTESTASLVEVERRLVRPTDDGWSDHVASSRLLVVSWASAAATPIGSELAGVVAEIRRVFPGAAVAEQAASARILAAVDGDADLERRTRLLRARCGELVRSTSPSVEVLAAPVDADSARQQLRGVG